MLSSNGRRAVRQRLVNPVSELVNKPLVTENGVTAKPFEHIVFTDFDGEEGILVDLNTKKYYQLNETAMVIWKSLEQGMTSDEIATRLVADYEVTPEDALRNVEQLLNELTNYKLVDNK